MQPIENYSLNHKNDDPLLVNTSWGFTLKYQQKDLYPSVDPVESANRRARGLKLNPDTLYLIPSPLLGYGLNVLLDRLPPNSHLLCIEIDQKLMYFSRFIPEPIKQDKRISIFRLESLSQLFSVYQEMNPSKFRKTALLSLNRGYSLNRIKYNQMAVFLDQTINQFWKNKITLIYMGKLWIKNIYKNLSDLTISPSQAIPKTEKPVIALGAGESIEEVLPLLKTERSKYYLLAADTALQVLKKSNINPDGVIALESQYWNLNDFIPFTGDFFLLSDLTSYPGIIRRHKGPCGFFLTQFTTNNLFKKLADSGINFPLIPPLGSVGIAAAYLALSITKQEIFLYGMDFCFKPGKTHARGTPQHDRILKDTKRTNPVDYGFNLIANPSLHKRKNRKGDEVLTNPAMEGYMHTLNQLLTLNKRISVPSKKSLPLMKVDTAVNSLAPLADLEAEKKDAVLLFLEKESSDLKKLSEMLICQLNNMDTPTKNLDKALLDFDYIFCHFPDKELPNHSKHFYKRALFESEMLKDLIDKELNKKTPTIKPAGVSSNQVRLVQQLCKYFK